MTEPVKTPEAVEAIITEIARSHLDIPSLEERHSDQLDFHEISVWRLRAALASAYAAGARANCGKTSTS